MQCPTCQKGEIFIHRYGNGEQECRCTFCNFTLDLRLLQGGRWKLLCKMHEMDFASRTWQEDGVGGYVLDLADLHLTIEADGKKWKFWIHKNSVCIHSGVARNRNDAEQEVFKYIRMELRK